MKKLIIIIGIVVLAGAAFAFMVDSESGTWRYKITVNVQTPEGIKSGSAIREISKSYTDLGTGTPESTSKAKVRGEAVVIDLGDKGKLFGLIDGGAYHEVNEVFPYTAGKGIPDSIRHFKNLPVGSKGEFKNKRRWPRFVMFDDLSDPLSVKPVHQSFVNGEIETKSNFSEVYGEGYTIESIDIEITDEPIDWQITKILSWIKEYRNKRLDGSRFGTVNTEHSVANSLSMGSFTIGEDNE